MENGYLFFFFVICKRVSYWELTKPQTYLRYVSCFFFFFLVLLMFIPDSMVYLENHSWFCLSLDKSLPSKMLSPNFQGKGINLEKASWIKEDETQVFQVSDTSLYWWCGSLELVSIPLSVSPLRKEGGRSITTDISKAAGTKWVL